MAAYSNVPAFLLDALFGQSNQPHVRMTGGEVLRTAKYVNVPTPLDLRDALDQMCFPELGIAPYTSGRFDQYLKYELARIEAGETRVGKVPSKGAFKPKPPKPPKAEAEAGAEGGTGVEKSSVPIAPVRKKLGMSRRAPDTGQQLVSNQHRGHDG